MNGNNNPFRGKSKKPNYSCVTGGGTKNIIPYSEEALEYFQEMNDKDEFMTEPVGGDYIDYLLGDITNGTDGLDMDTEFEDLCEDSDWFMD